MEAKVALTALDGALGLIEALGPIIQKMVSAGEISVVDQKVLDDRIAALRPGGTMFAGPEWKVE